METSQTLEVPMKSKDNLVAWVKNHAKLPERIDKDEYELIKWSTMIHQVIVMETSQTCDDNKQLSKDTVNTQTDSDGNITDIGSANEIERQSGSMGQESCKITRKN